MIYLELFLAFLKVGCFSFGGAYSAIPLIRDVVLSYGWITDETLSYMIAVSESTPGPIMINMATYVGSTCGGVLGAMIATFSVSLPAFAIIILIVSLLKNALENKYVNAVLGGLKPCVIGVILAIGIYMLVGTILPELKLGAFDINAAIIAVLIIGIRYGYKLLFKKKMSSITLIVVSAFLGIAAYGIHP